MALPGVPRRQNQYHKPQSVLSRVNIMKKIISLLLIFAVAGCATCKSSDTMEQCRTKQRDKSQKYSSLVVAQATFLQPASSP
jgi:hypothetical protein